MEPFGNYKGTLRDSQRKKLLVVQRKRKKYRHYSHFTPKTTTESQERFAFQDATFLLTLIMFLEVAWAASLSTMRLCTVSFSYIKKYNIPQDYNVLKISAFFAINR